MHKKNDKIRGIMGRCGQNNKLQLFGMLLDCSIVDGKTLHLFYFSTTEQLMCFFYCLPLWEALPLRGTIHVGHF